MAELSDALLRHEFRETICKLVCCNTAECERVESEIYYKRLLSEAISRKWHDFRHYQGFWDFYSSAKEEIISGAEQK